MLLRVDLRSKPTNLLPWKSLLEDEHRTDLNGKETREGLSLLRERGDGSAGRWPVGEKRSVRPIISDIDRQGLNFGGIAKWRRRGSGGPFKAERSLEFYPTVDI